MDPVQLYDKGERHKVRNLPNEAMCHRWPEVARVLTNTKLGPFCNVVRQLSAWRWIVSRALVLGAMHLLGM